MKSHYFHEKVNNASKWLRLSPASVPKQADSDQEPDNRIKIQNTVQCMNSINASCFLKSTHHNTYSLRLILWFHDFLHVWAFYVHGIPLLQEFLYSFLPNLSNETSSEAGTLICESVLKIAINPWIWDWRWFGITTADRKTPTGHEHYFSHTFP